MNETPLVSLCMPTNGVVEWVFPVLDSIFSQGVDNSLFEVVITDNGDNQKFKKKIKEYSGNHTNIVYAETRALPFLNEIESYKRASGELIKFINHRTMLLEGSLKRLVDYAERNMERKPITYFTNGVLKLSPDCHEYDSFDLFVRNLSYWSSCSTGMAIWKSDFDKLPEKVDSYNELFPHTTVLFNERNRGKYVIDNSIILNEIPQGKIPKGSYDLFGAFGIEYPGIICDLLRDGSISNKTFRVVSDKNLEFIAELYFNYCIRKKYCSYDLNGLENMFGVFYTKSGLYKMTVKYVINRIGRKISRLALN